MILLSIIAFFIIIIGGIIILEKFIMKPWLLQKYKREQEDE